MVDSSAPSGDRRNRSERPQNDRGERKPYQRDGERKPYSRDGKPAERKTWGSRDSKPGERSDRGERKPYQRDGERKPYQRDGERKTYQRDGERKTYQRDGERKPYQRDGERKPYQRDGERKPWENRDSKPGERSERRTYGDRPRRDGDGRGERKPYQRDGERKPYQRDGERKPYQRDGERKPYQRDGERKPWENRDGKPGERSERRPYGDRPRRDGDDRPRRDDDRPRRDFRDENGDFAPRHNDPELPDSVIARDLDKGAYAELKGLSKENAERVARHLVASALALEVDPELAHEHALAAARTAGRIAVVRETVAITAYETGDYALALRELRTFRRLSGKNTHIALIVDSERGLGRPERALEEGRAVDRATIPVESRVALAIAMSGARLDLNQPEIALGELEIAELDPNRAFTYSPMLFHAYAEVLDELGRAKDSAEWRHRAEVAQAAIDEEYGVNDVIEVYEEIDEAIDDVIDAAEGYESDELDESLAGEDAVEDEFVDVVSIDDEIDDDENVDDQSPSGDEVAAREPEFDI